MYLGLGLTRQEKLKTSKNSGLLSLVLFLGKVQRTQWVKKSVEIKTRDLVVMSSQVCRATHSIKCFEEKFNHRSQTTKQCRYSWMACLGLEHMIQMITNPFQSSRFVSLRLQLTNIKNGKKQAKNMSVLKLTTLSDTLTGKRVLKWEPPFETKTKARLSFLQRLTDTKFWVTSILEIQLTLKTRWAKFPSSHLASNRKWSHRASMCQDLELTRQIRTQWINKTSLIG